MTAYLLQSLVFVATFLLLAWLALPRSNPLAVAFRPLGRTVTRPRYFLFVISGLSIILIDYILTTLDPHFTRAVVQNHGQDYTSLVWHLEGNTTAWFQRHTWPPLTWFLAWAYITGFQIAVPWAMAVFDWLGQTRRNLSLLFALILNYLLVFPFYVFFPVRECHAFDPGGGPIVRLALDDVHPAIMQAIRPMSGLDNCFPSFHTSLIVTVALFAWQSGRRSFQFVAAILAASVIFSTLYLGIHWVTDVLAGIPTGVLATVLGSRLARAWYARREDSKPPAADQSPNTRC